MKYFRCVDCTEVFQDEALGSDVQFCPSCGGRLFYYEEAEVIPADVEPKATHESSSKPTRFKSKEEYFQWKEERLKSTQSSKNFICPHCEEAIPVSVTVCPFCAENVNSPVQAIPKITTTKEVPVTTKEPQEFAAQKITEKTPEINPVKTRIFYIVGGLISFFILIFIILSMRYEEADYEHFRYRYDRFTKTVYRAPIVLITKYPHKTNLWRKTRFVSLQQAISLAQQRAREEIREAIENAANEQQRAAYEQKEAIEDAIEEQKRAMEDAADEQQQAIEDAIEDAEFERLMQRR